MFYVKYNRLSQKKKLYRNTSHLVRDKVILNRTVKFRISLILVFLVYEKTER